MAMHKIIETSEARELIKYKSGEYQVRDTVTGFVSDWLCGDDVAIIRINPEVMAEYECEFELGINH